MSSSSRPHSISTSGVVRVGVTRRHEVKLCSARETQHNHLSPENRLIACLGLLWLIEKPWDVVVGDVVLKLSSQ
jgi:hypothetical protein